MNWPLGWNYVRIKKIHIDVNKVRTSLLMAESWLSWVSQTCKQWICPRRLVQGYVYQNGSSYGDIRGQKSHETITIIVHCTGFLSSVEMSSRESWISEINSRPRAWNQLFPISCNPALPVFLLLTQPAVSTHYILCPHSQILSTLHPVSSVEGPSTFPKTPLSLLLHLCSTGEVWIRTRSCPDQNIFTWDACLLPVEVREATLHIKTAT